MSMREGASQDRKDRRGLLKTAHDHGSGGLTDLRALELPRGEAARMEVVAIRSGLAAVAVELDFKLGFFLQGFTAADRANRPSPMTAPRAVGPSDGQTAFVQRDPSLLPEYRLVRHMLGA